MEPPQHHIHYNDVRRELNLTHCNLKTLSPAVISAYGHCTVHLDLSYNSLSDLNWLYAFEHLKYLILDCNRLHEAHLRRLPQPLANIKLLMLNKNELSDLESSIEIISRTFPNLEYLSLHGNPICPDGLELQPFAEYVPYDYGYYRSYIANSLSELKFLDHTAVSQRELQFDCQPSFSRTPVAESANTLTTKLLWTTVSGCFTSAGNTSPERRTKYQQENVVFNAEQFSI